MGRYRHVLIPERELELVTLQMWYNDLPVSPQKKYEVWFMCSARQMADTDAESLPDSQTATSEARAMSFNKAAISFYFICCKNKLMNTD
jgi:hypothetical protein